MSCLGSAAFAAAAAGEVFLGLERGAPPAIQPFASSPPDLSWSVLPCQEHTQLLMVAASCWGNPSPGQRRKCGPGSRRDEL